MNPELLQGFYLRDWYVDPPKGALSRGENAEHLPPMAMEVLLRLASSPGELVTREKLLEDVWGVDKGSQEALNHAIAEVRRALGDDSSVPDFIQTLPRRGYRLLIEPALDTDHTESIVLGTRNAASIAKIGLFESLNRRGVFETGLAYLIVGWLLIQIADIVFDQLLLPRWAGTFVTVLVIAGFPIAIVLSWFLEFRDGRAVLEGQNLNGNLKRRFNRTYLSVIGALAIAAVAVFFYDKNIGLPEAQRVAIARNDQAQPPPIHENSIAVLPFLNIDGSEQTQIFASGFAEDVINRLARLPGLLVSSRGDSWSLAPNSPSQEVRRRLRVEYYLEGSVRLTGDILRVVVQLIDSETGFHIVSRSFDKELENFNQVQDEITRLTIANLQIALPAGSQSILAANYDEADLDAYILYRRGKEIYERPRTFETVAETISLYEQALELDPRYAAAHAGLCNAYISKYNLTDSAENIERAETACGSALASNPRLFMVHSALGDLYRRTGRLSEAQESYSQALEINSQSAEAMSGLAAVYQQQSKSSEAEELLHTAIVTQPGNWRAINSLGRFLFAMGRYEEAADAYRQVIFVDPENFQARANLGSALTMVGDFEKGKEAFEAALEIQPMARTLSNVGVLHYYLGQFDDSIQAHRQAIELAPRDPLKYLNLADTLYFAGQIEESQNMFRRADELSLERLAVDSSDSDTMYVHAWARQMLGDSDTAREFIVRGMSIAPANPYGFYYAALIETRNGDFAAAINFLESAVDNGYPAVMLAAEPYLNELRSHRDFEALVSESE